MEGIFLVTSRTWHMAIGPAVAPVWNGCCRQFPALSFFANSMRELLVRKRSNQETTRRPVF